MVMDEKELPKQLKQAEIEATPYFQNYSDNDGAISHFSKASNG